MGQHVYILKRQINQLRVSLLSSQLEETNEGYALAKIVSLKYSQHIKKGIKRIHIINASTIYMVEEIILILNLATFWAGIGQRNLLSPKKIIFPKLKYGAQER